MRAHKGNMIFFYFINFCTPDFDSDIGKIGIEISFIWFDEGSLFFAKNVYSGWTNVLVYKILKVQKTLGISWIMIDSQE